MYGSTTNSRLKYIRSSKWKKQHIYQHTISHPKSGWKSCLTKGVSEEKEAVIQPYVADKRTKVGKRSSKIKDTAQSMLKTDESDCDLISIVYRKQDAKWLTISYKDLFVLDDNGSENMDIDSDPDNWSITSGPSSTYSLNPENMCFDCKVLVKKAKKMKTTLKKKPQNDDPKSLLCDQWVLSKKRAPGTIPKGERRLVRCIQSIEQRCIEARLMPSEQREQEFCSRPHSFLQRNLRSCTRKPMECTRKERGRTLSQGSCAIRRKQIQDKDQAVKVTCRNISGSKKQNPPHRFRHLLGQLHSNGSMIFREKH